MTTHRRHKTWMHLSEVMDYEKGIWSLKMAVNQSALWDLLDVFQCSSCAVGSSCACIILVRYVLFQSRLQLDNKKLSPTEKLFNTSLWFSDTFCYHAGFNPHPFDTYTETWQTVTCWVFKKTHGSSQHPWKYLVMTQNINNLVML